MANAEPVEALVEVARHAVERAGAAAMRHFRTDLVIDTKPDRSPVTAADREAEAAILETIGARFPGHAILAEESGLHAGAPGKRWIVDPLDGTRGFSRGGPFWGPLVAFESGGEIVAGALALPALGTTYYAGRGLGAFRDGERLRVSSVGSLEEATVSLGELRALLSPPRREGVETLVERAASARCYGDLAGCTMVLDGCAEVWVEAGVKPWDLAPLVVLVEEAGGRFTDLGGGKDLGRGDAVATNGVLHDVVLGHVGDQ